MGARGLRWAVVVAGPAVAAGMLTGCGDDEDSTSPYRYPLGHAEVAGPGLGLGEWSDDDIGDRRVLQVSDAEVDAETPPARTVTALVEICAPPERAEVTSGSDWQLVLDSGDTADATGGLHPTEDGAPAIAGSGRVAAGDCAFADIDFSVPEETVTVGMTYRTDGGQEVRWSWFPEHTRPDA